MKERKAGNRKRKAGNRKRKAGSYLIVTEGEQTEPNYFDGLANCVREACSGGRIDVPSFDDEALLHTTLPISAGLLHDIGSYMAALDAYHEGSIKEIITCLVDAVELAVVVGARIASDVDEVFDAWRAQTTDRADSASHRLPALLVEQPVVNTTYVAQKLGVSDRTARTLVESACERGILSKMGNAQRGAYYQATALVNILEEASSIQGIRRIAAR